MHRERAGTRRTTPLGRSFGHAWRGLIGAAGQRNMRIHLVAGILAGAFAATVRLGAAERALIVLCIGLVLAAEAFNTALEAVVDLHGTTHTESGRIAKDAAAGAVLLLAAASVGVFSLVAAGRWSEIASAWRALLPSGVAALALGSIAGWLTSPGRRPPSWVAALGAAGALLAALLASRAACAPCVALPAALFAVAVAVAILPGGGRQ